MNFSELTSLSRTLDRLVDDPVSWVFLGLIGVLVAALIRLWDRLGLLERDVARLRYRVEQDALARPPAVPSTAEQPAATPQAPAAATTSTPSTSGAPVVPRPGAPAPSARPATTTASAPARRVRDLPLLSEISPQAADTPDGRSATPAAPASTQASTATRAPFVDETAGGLVASLFSGGNWLVRGGIVLLFIGVGFLLKFAADNALLPVELRLAAVAAGGLALVLGGLRLAHRRRTYALALQGGGIGLLYLTLYASFRLYGLLPAAAAFTLMFGVVVAAGWLAWRQDALVLAVLGALGGFAAPLLASTGTGSHVLLFSYYAVLNLGVLGLAVARSWRALNLVGFGATFVLSALWGHRFYDPVHLASVEPFLILFFAMYLCVAVLFAMRRRIALADPMDSTLVFGAPLVAFGLQSRLVAGTAHGLTLTALALTLVYGGLWYWIRRRDDEDLAVLAEAFAALAAGFLAVAAALALDARWTSASWALEGAALVWIGWRQRRPLARLAGAGLQLLAGAAWVGPMLERSHWEPGDWLGTVMLALAALVSSAALGQQRGERAEPDEQPLGIVLGVWGLGFWFVGGGVQLADWLSAPPLPGALLLFAAASAVALHHLGVRFGWAVALIAARLLPFLLVLLAFVSLLENGHPLESLAVIGWPVALLAAIWILRTQESAAAALLAPGHLLCLWLTAGLAAWELAWWFERLLPAVESWQRLAWVLAPAAVVALVTLGASREDRWPFPTRARLYLEAGAGPLVCIVGGGLFALSVADPHGPWPLGYLPMLNPLDLGLALATAACVFWMTRAREFLAVGMRNVLVGAGAALAFIWINGALLRTLHFWWDIPYRFSGFMNSTAAQASISVLWAVTGLAAMVAASRACSRTLWLVGAGLMGVVMIKLLLVDLASSATIARIVSFISVGLLMMLVGYLAPVPPRSAERDGDGPEDAGSTAA